MAKTGRSQDDKIIERKKAEEKLRHMALAVDQAPDGIAIADMEGNLQFANPAWVKMHGYEGDELLGQNLSVCHTEEQMQKEVAAQIGRVMKNGSDQGELGHKRRDGTPFPAWMSTTLIKDEKGNSVGMLGIARDITEQKEAEEKLRYLARAVEQVPDGIAITNAEGRLQFVNLAWATMHGYTVDELLGQHLSVCHTEEQLQRDVNPNMEMLMKTGSDQREIGHKRRDGSTFPTWMSSTALKDERDRLGGLVAIARDITEQKEAEAERERLQQQIIDAQQLALKELSTPVIPIYKRADVGSILVMPLIGTVDTKRAKDITRRLLAAISEHEASIIILDITGVPIVDTGVADHLNKTVQAARLKGAQAIVTGVSDAVAETIVELGVEWEGVQILRNLQTGLIAALNWMGVRLDNK